MHWTGAFAMSNVFLEKLISVKVYGELNLVRALGEDMIFLYMLVVMKVICNYGKQVIS